MKKVIVTSLIVLFSASVVSQAHAIDSPFQEKIERTRAIMLADKQDKENASTSSNGRLSNLHSASEEGGSLAGTAIKMFGALGLCLGVLGMAVKGLRKYSPQQFGGKGRRIKIIERQPVSTKTSLLLAEIEGKRVLLSVGPDRVSFYEAGDGIDQAADLGESLYLQEQTQEQEVFPQAVGNI